MPETLDLRPVTVAEGTSGEGEALDLQPVAAAPAKEEALDLQPVTGEARSSLTKAYYAGLKGLAGAAASVLSTDVGPGRDTFGRHERALELAGENWWELPREGASAEGQGLAIVDAARAARREQLRRGPEWLRAGAENAGTVAEATPGSAGLAKAAEFAGGSVPFLLSGPAAPVTGFLSTSAETEREALEFYRKQGLSEAEAYKRAQEDAARAGLVTGATFGLLPGAAGTLAGRVVSRNLGPMAGALARTAVAGPQAGAVMGADVLARDALAKGSFRPDLTWGQALQEAGETAAAGTLMGGVIHGAGEAVGAGVRGVMGGTKGEAGTGKAGEARSEFGGEREAEVAVPAVPAEAETANGERSTSNGETGAEAVPKVERALPEVQALGTDEGEASGGAAAGLLGADEATAELQDLRKRQAAAELAGRTKFERETEVTGPDVLDWMRDNMKLLSKSGAREAWSAEKFQQNQSLWDDARTLPMHHAVEVYSPKGFAPDRVAQAAFNDGVIKDPSVNELWRAIDQASRTREKAVDTYTRERGQQEAEGEQAYLAARDQGGTEAPSGSESGTEVTPAEASADDTSEPEVSRDVIERWFDDAIEAVKPGTAWTGEASLGLAKLPVWLGQEAAGAALRVAKLAYTTGRDLAKAIAAGVEHLRGLKLDGFEEREAREWLTNTLGERATGQTILGSTALSEELKGRVTQYLYERRTNAGDDDLARGLVETFGVDGAEAVLREPPVELHGATWSRLLGEVTRALTTEETRARASGDKAGAEALAERQGRLWDDMLPRVTELAQSLQALTDMVDMSPDGQVARVRRRLERAADETVRQRQPELTQMQTALEQGRAAGVEQVRQDPAVNGAARAAVDAAVAGSEETHKAVIMELAAEWSESPIVVNQARELVRSRAQQILGKNPLPIGKSATEYLRATMDDLAKRAASIAANYFQGMAAHPEGLAGLYRERLGLEEGAAKRLAARMDKEFARQVEAARRALPKRIAAQRVARERAGGVLDLNAPTPAVDGAIRRQLKGLNLKLGDVLRQEAGAQERTGKHVAERVVEASGLTGAEADTLRTVLENRWNALVTAAQRARLAQLEQASGTRVKGGLRPAFEKLAELDRLGALTGTEFLELVKKQLKLRSLTAGDAAELRRLAQRASEQPGGSFLRQRAQAEVLKLTEKLAGERRWGDVPMAIWYANVLSGLTTPAKIVFENTNLLVGNTVAGFLARPGEWARPWGFAKALAGAYQRGIVKGALQGADTLRKGVVSGVYGQVRGPGVLEMKPFGTRLEPLNFWKWFTRAISVTHEATFKPAWEFQQTMLAREVARGEGLRGEALQRRVADLLADTADQVADARAQALGELSGNGATPDRLDLARRTREILEQRREANLPGSTERARDYALRTVYLNEPYGFLGLIANGVRTTLEKGRQRFPVTGTAAKMQVPFTTVVANILNEKLNWTPWGLVRAGVSHRTGELYGRPMMGSGERAELYAKAIAGTVALGALGALLGDRIHGNGPSDPRRRKQLAAAGWIPHSLELGGRYYSYMNTPAALGLAWMGNWRDWQRYGKGEEADGVSRLAFAVKAMANVIVSQGMLDSVKRIFEALGSESTTEGAGKMEKALARTATTLVVPNLVQQADRLWDPTVYDQTGVGALLQSQVPFVRRGGRPVLNVLGEPVQSGLFHYWASAQSQDPVWRTLADRGLYVPEPSKATVIGMKKLGPEYYRAMTPDEYYGLVAESGPKIRKALEGQLEVLRQLTPNQGQALVNKIAEAHHAAARMKLQ